MPRTKQSKRTTAKRKSDMPAVSKHLTKKQLSAMKSQYLKEMTEETNRIIENMESEYLDLMDAVEPMFQDIILSIPRSFLTKTVAEIKSLNAVDLTNSVVNSTTMRSLINITNNSIVQTAKNKHKRSLSQADDEGYLTAESSSAGTSGHHVSRTSGRRTKNARVSRSLSRSTMQKSVSVMKQSFKTPLDRAPPSRFNTVTPKMKPNVPQVVLRRPKHGEVAISMQGSPLMVGSVTSDEVANVNIPLQDGRLLSIQAQRGLRMSQIPELDAITHRQLETLRDNLNKVCAISIARF